MELTKASLVLLLSTLISLFAASESKGQWKLLKRSLGISAMHMQLLHDGSLLSFDRTDAGPSNISLPLGRCLLLSDHQPECTAHSVLFNPSNRNIRALIITTDTFCSSGSLSSNGTLIQTGGYGAGDHTVRYFSPCENCDWIEHSQGLSNRRWYATNHILPDERVIVVGGRAQFNYEFVPKQSTSDYHVFSLPFLKETTDGSSENNLYPFLHLSTDGNLFIFANTRAILLDYLNNKVVRSYQEMPGGISRNYPSSGSSVLVPLMMDNSESPARAEVMICGGAETGSFSKVQNGTFLPASSSCGRLVITDESPEWQMEEMPMGRVMGDMILLPTGDILIINGAGKGTGGWGNARDPVRCPVLYNTSIRGNVRSNFQVLSCSSIPRLYHSTAHLIPDGRVLVGGSNPNIRYQFSGVLFPTELSLEAYSPPYLNSNRPNITSLEPETNIMYGQKVSISFVIKGNFRDVVKVTMVAPSFTTHSFSMNQRLLVLEKTEASQIEGHRYKVEALAPASAVLAPPGYYMLFVVHGGVPSKAKWVRMIPE